MGNLATLATLIIEEISITKKMYGWSKHGGARHGLVKTDDSIWYCQCCGNEQAREMPGYMHGINDREYLRICAQCWSELIGGITLTKLIEQVRRKGLMRFVS